MSYKELSTILKVLSDPSRLEMLDLLSCGELCACDLLEYFQFSQPTISHHMKSLVDNDLVITRKNGNKHMYQLNREFLDYINQNLNIINSPNQRYVCKSMKLGEC
ncbi:metalloregulator ArsR/SmtB family transcription factor [Staphylococcus pasteuri]|uniref:ArsR/SmtB family transcription factor n=1 Tax=Staphylococcus TaxID=1279 RepID=UPI00048E297B|nr:MULTISPECIES: metalloregulator ArsR/SmtB family transcription factor [Staphylococcus]ODB81841.1 transcriptional regulator [Staphylococcus sp. AOAB]MBM6508432.1 winged helix-turn-helix transcriptional regulator [Staphylococcus pasteuri]MCO0862659.1 metalloregulator ArsR/SmtB family transcription factor [Staphylococcus pasteuri]MCT1927640.1 metalloregulator ArsR/SmtB family transcription factor [Staphylococcus pasteuri]QDW85670.1 ArsR family transcriptional regulator [Staphylococcus pasteuri]